jgi:hypothetical protein
MVRAVIYVVTLNDCFHKVFWQGPKFCAFIRFKVKESNDVPLRDDQGVTGCDRG